MKVTFDRWPWQSPCTRWYLGRFGGGWNYSLGVKCGGRTIIFDLLFGSIRISWEKKPRATLNTATNDLPSGDK